MDQCLKLFHFPSELPVWATHRPNEFKTVDHLEYQYTFRTNSQGLRYREIPLERPSGTHRILVLGDSFVEGVGVEEEERFTERLEEIFSQNGQKTEWINLGLGASGPFQYGRALMHVGIRYHPQAVLVCLYANDLPDVTPDYSAKEMDPDWKSERSGLKKLLHALIPRVYILLLRSRHQFYILRQRQAERHFPASVIDQAKKLEIPEERIRKWQGGLPREWAKAVNENRLIGAPLVYGLLQPDYLAESLDIPSKNSEMRWLKMIEILDEIHTYLNQREIPMALVYFPAKYQHDAGTFSNPSQDLGLASGVKIKKDWLTGETELEKRITNYARTRQIPFLNLTPFFRNAVPTTPGISFPLDSHWTPKGHALAAYAIAKWVREERVFKIT